MSRRNRFEDDGRTVADMSGLEGAGLFAKRPHSSQTTEMGTDEEKVPFTWKERLRYMGAALGAALLVAFVFLSGIALIIWLITLYA